jgi:hypothetical protein
MSTTNNEDQLVDGQPLLVGDRVDSGYNQHDVFYQLRQTSSQWILYCRYRTDRDTPVYDGEYDEWLDVCKGTPNHPKGLTIGYVAAALAPNEQVARGKLQETTEKKAEAELERALKSVENDLWERRYS